MPDPLRTAADILVALKPQFIQLARHGWGCEVHYQDSFDRPETIDGQEPMPSELDSARFIKSVELNASPHLFSFRLHGRSSVPTPEESDALHRFISIAGDAGRCLQSIDNSPLPFSSTFLATARTANAEAFWLLAAFGLAWQRRAGALAAERTRTWGAYSFAYEMTREQMQGIWQPDTLPGRFVAALMSRYPERLPDFFSSKLDNIAAASALAIDALAADLYQLAEPDLPPAAPQPVDGAAEADPVPDKLTRQQIKQLLLTHHAELFGVPADPVREVPNPIDRLRKEAERRQGSAASASPTADAVPLVAQPLPPDPSPPADIAELRERIEQEREKLHLQLRDGGHDRPLPERLTEELFVRFVRHGEGLVPPRWDFLWTHIDRLNVRVRWNGSRHPTTVADALVLLAAMHDATTPDWAHGVNEQMDEARNAGKPKRGTKTGAEAGDPSRPRAADARRRRAKVIKKRRRQATRRLTINYLGNRAYRVGRKNVTVSNREDSLLEAFIGRPSMDLPALASRSRLDSNSIPSVVSRLRKKYDGLFRDAVTVPGTKGKGGYGALVIDASKRQV